MTTNLNSMMIHHDTEVAQIGVRLLDHAHFAWSRAQSECERAMQAWFTATGGQRATAYDRYQASLDREEAAARDLQRLWELSQPCRETLLIGQTGACE